MILSQTFITVIAIPIVTWSASHDLSAEMAEVTDVAIAKGSGVLLRRATRPDRGASITATMETAADMRGRPDSRRRGGDLSSAMVRIEGLID